MSTTFAPGTYTLNVGAATSLTFDLAGSAVNDAGAFDNLPLGKGGRLQATIPVTPYENLTLIVAGAPAKDGTPSTHGHGLGGTPYGGCSSAVLRGATVLLEAGGAGGPGYSTALAQPRSGITPGDGGGSGAGTAGTALSGSSSTGGGAASTSSVGTAGSPGGTSGSGSNGGAGGVSGNSHGGGGGGGYEGGGGGAYDTTSGYGTGGGGGSGHADSSASDVTGTTGYQVGDGYITVDAVAASVPSWLTPADGSTFDAAEAVDLAYLFQGAAGDVQTQRQWRYSTNGGTTWTTNVVEVTGSTTISLSGSAGDYQVQVQTWGKQLGASGWSASLHITLATRPAAPTPTSPTPDATVTDTTVDVAWSMTNRQGYQVQVAADDGTGSADLGSVTYDTGQVIDPNTTDLPAVPLDASLNGHDAHILIYGRASNLWSLAADVTIHVDYPLPPVASIVLTEDPVLARIVLTLTTPGPGSGQVTAMSAKVENRRVDDQVTDWSRSGDAVALNGDTIYATPTKGVDYEFRVTTVGSNGATAASGWVGSATGTADDEAPLLDGGTAANPEGVLV